MGQRFIAIALVLAMLPACWGYNGSSKRWAYAGNAVLMAAGVGAIAVDATSTEEACMGDGCRLYKPPFTGVFLAGVLLVSAGLVGILLTASRADVKSSR